MRFMLIRKADKAKEAGVLPSQRLLKEMLDYIGERGKAFIFRAGEGLLPTSEGSCVKFSSGKPTVFDGPSPKPRNSSPASP